ncbi:MAG: VOC family protein [Porticoccaceae bacterium]|nr:VOC family protein [Porticoccaceae bacterium]
MTDDRFALPIRQVCWNVDDIDKAIEGWLQLGVGPFVIFDVDLPGALYRGQPIPLRGIAALAQAGPLQIELFQQISDGYSAYRDGPQAQMGLHHGCREIGRYDEWVARMHAGGFDLITEVPSGEIRVCYADTRAAIGFMLEFVDDHPLIRRLNEHVRDIALDWDGTDPVRPISLEEFAAQQ